MGGMLICHYTADQFNYGSWADNLREERLQPKKRTLSSLCLLLACGTLALPARAKVSEIRISKQYGLPYLSVAVVEQNQLIEKHAKAIGLAGGKVNWVTIARRGHSTRAL